MSPARKLCVYCGSGNGRNPAYMAAARTDIDASVGYYGVMIDQMLNESHAIANPLMLHIPTADGFVPPETQAAMHTALDDHPRVTLYDYEGLDHGFATEHGNRRDEDGARLADLMIEYDLGVSVAATYQLKRIDSDFFADE